MPRIASMKVPSVVPAAPHSVSTTARFCDSEDVDSVAAAKVVPRTAASAPRSKAAASEPQGTRPKKLPRQLDPAV